MLFPSFITAGVDLSGLIGSLKFSTYRGSIFIDGTGDLRTNSPEQSNALGIMLAGSALHPASAICEILYKPNGHCARSVCFIGFPPIEFHSIRSAAGTTFLTRMQIHLRMINPIFKGRESSFCALAHRNDDLLVGSGRHISSRINALH